MKKIGPNTKRDVVIHSANYIPENRAAVIHILVKTRRGRMKASDRMELAGFSAELKLLRVAACFLGEVGFEILCQGFIDAYLKSGSKQGK